MKTPLLLLAVALYVSIGIPWAVITYKESLYEQRIWRYISPLLVIFWLPLLTIIMIYVLWLVMFESDESRGLSCPYYRGSEYQPKPR